MLRLCASPRDGRGNYNLFTRLHLFTQNKYRDLLAGKTNLLISLKNTIKLKLNAKLDCNSDAFIVPSQPLVKNLFLSNWRPTLNQQKQIQNSERLGVKSESEFRSQHLNLRQSATTESNS